MWQVQFPKGWYDIDQDVQAQISSAYQAGRPTVQFATVKSQRLGLYRRYIIDFGSLQQRNLDSGRLQPAPAAQPGTSEAFEADTCNNVFAATLMIEDDTKASSSHCGSDSQPDGRAFPQSTPDTKPVASEVTGDNTSNIVTAATFAATSRMNKIPRTEGQHSPPDKRIPGDDGHQ